MKNLLCHFVWCIGYTMKISTLAWLITVLFWGVGLAEDSKAQQLDKIKISVNFHHVTLEKALTQLEDLSGLGLIYNNALDLRRPIRDLEADQISVAQVLTHLLKDTEFTFKQEGNNVLLIKKPEPVKVVAGEIQGKIYDRDNQEGLVGANVRLEGTSIGASADVEGNFVLRNVPVGTYNLVASFIGYQSSKIENIQVTEGAVALLDIPLVANIESLAEVVVVGHVDVRYAPLQHSTEQSLLSEMKAANFIVTGISNEQISRSLDRDAGDVVKRIPGVTLIDQFTLIRGLDPRYNATFINNTIAPSVEMDRRDFSFDLIPTGVIDQITVYKTPAPELPGMFAGGVIKVKTKSAATARRIQLGISGQYRTGGSSFADAYGYTGQSDKDWYAGGLKDRRMSAGLYDLDYIFPSIDTYPDENRALVAENQYYNLKHAHQNFDKRMNLSYYDSWLLGNVRWNNLTAMGYTGQGRFRKTRFLYRGGQYNLNSTGGYTNILPDLDYTDSSYYKDVRLTAMQNWSFVLNKYHTITFENFFNRLGRDETTVRTGFPDDTQRVPIKYFNYFYSVRDLYTGSLGGTHSLPIQQLNIHWSASYSRTYEQAPDYQRTRYTGSGESWQMILETGVNQTNREGSLTTEENSYLYSLDLEQELPTGALLKLGGLYQKKDRQFTSLGYMATATVNNAAQNTVEGRAPWTSLDVTFAPDNFYPDGGYEFIRVAGLGVYSVDDELWAGYAGLKWSFFKQQMAAGRLQVYGGVRYEYNNRQIYDFSWNNIKIETITLGDSTYTVKPLQKVYWLPSLNVSYNFDERWLLRAAYGKTLDRPNYREMSQFSFYEYRTNTTVLGNPLLHNAEVDNIDLRLECYPKAGEFFAVGFFYKYFKNPIEAYDNTPSAAQGTTRISYLNTRNAVVYGAEVELRKSLRGVHALLNNFSVILNASYNDGEIETYDKDIYGSLLGGGLADKKRILQGLSPYIVNAGLYYDNDRLGTKASALYNVAGQRLRVVATVSNPNAYELPRHVIDLTLTQKVSDMIAIKVGVQDLLNQPVRVYRDESLNEKYDPENVVFRSGGTGTSAKYGDYLSSTYKPGSYYSVGVNFTF